MTQAAIVSGKAQSVVYATSDTGVGLRWTPVLPRIRYAPAVLVLHPGGFKTGAAGPLNVCQVDFFLAIARAPIPLLLRGESRGDHVHVVSKAGSNHSAVPLRGTREENYLPLVARIDATFQLCQRATFRAGRIAGCGAEDHHAGKRRALFRMGLRAEQTP